MKSMNVTPVTNENIDRVTGEVTINPDVVSANDDSNHVTDVATENARREVDLTGSMILCGVMQEGAVLGEASSDGIRRFPDRDDPQGKKTGWVCEFHDEEGLLVAANYGTWRDEGNNRMWRETGYTALPEVEQRAIDAGIRRAGLERQELIVRSQKEARIKLKGELNNLAKIKDHPYFQRKGIKVQSTVYAQGSKAVIPMYNTKGELITAQRIDEDGTKRLASGCGKRGGFHLIKGDDSVLILTEGFATATSLHEATGYACAMVIDCGNLQAVAEDIAASPRYKNSVIVICADNDQFGEKNAGIEKGTVASKSIRSLMVAPEFKDLSTKPTDFNDLHQLEGLEAVAEQVSQVAKIALLGLPEGFAIKNDGVYSQQKNADGKIIESIVCSPLTVESMTRNDQSGNWGLQLKLDDPDGKVHFVTLPAEMLLTENEYLSVLVREGLKFDSSKRKILHNYLSSCKPRKRAMNTSKVGWIGANFVLPDRLIGNTNEEIVLQSSSFEKNGFEQKGTLEDWQENLSKLCIGNSRMIFAVSIAFASVLLPLVGEESAGFHFRCGSSRGKTTMLRLAKSVWGNPAQLPKWRATGNGIEGLATKHNHCLLCLDELGQADPKHIGDSVYMLGNGEGKQRAGRSGAARERQSWNLLFLSTGEISLAATLAKVGQKTMAGQEVRFIDLPADAGAGLGAFDTVHDYGGGSQFAIAINESSYKYHGTAAQAFIEHIAEDKAGYSQIAEEHINDFLGELNIEGADPQVQRVARKIALVYAGGMLATDFEITQWPYTDVLEACITCFDAWLEERGGDVSHEETQILEAIKSLLETEGDARFKDQSDYIRTNTSCWGIKAEGHFWVSTSAFKDALCRGFDTKKVIEVLTEKGYLVRGSDRPTVTKRSSSGSSRYYKIKESIVSYGFDDVDASAVEASEEEVEVPGDVSNLCELALGYSV